MNFRKMTKADARDCLNLYFILYEIERKSCPDLPDFAYFPISRSKLLSSMEELLDKNSPSYPGYVCLESDKSSHILGYMLPGYFFNFKNQKTVLVPEFCHAAQGDSKTRVRIYQRLYEQCAKEWVNQGRFLHLIGSFFHDTTLKETLFQLGFGGIVAERVRDLSPINYNRKRDISQVLRLEEMEEIELDHHLFYPHSPVFISKTTDPDKIRDGLKEYFDKKDVIFAYRDKGTIQGYIIVGESAEDGEGLLLRKTQTAQVKSAFIQPEYRNREIGGALLNRAVTWAAENGYERLFVEHETANIYGGNFWKKYFEGYLVFSMRYVDNSLCQI